MKPDGLRLVGMLAALVLLAGATRAQEANGKDKDKEGQSLVGTWKMVSAKFGGQENDLPGRMTVLKHITPTHFTWVRIDPESGNVVAMAGGPYTLEGDAYTETIEYGIGFGPSFDAYRGKDQSFTRKLDGHTWHHVGKLSTGLEIDEVWERVAKK